MAELNITFVNVSDSSEIDVELDDSMTNEQIVKSLIREKFIPPLNDSRAYILAVKGAGLIAEKQTLAAAKVRSGDYIRITVAQRGGGSPLSSREDKDRSQLIQWAEINDIATNLSFVGLFTVKRIYRDHITLQGIYKEDVRNCIFKYIKLSSRYKLIHAVLQLIIFIGAAIVSVTLAITEIPHWFPAIVSGTVVIATAIVNYYKLGERSTNLYLTAENMQHEYNRFITARSIYKGLEPRDALNTFMDKIENIMQNHTKQSIAIEKIKDTHDKTTA